ncbi:5'-3' exonuclease [Schinkia sp. CFF1]
MAAQFRKCFVVFPSTHSIYATQISIKTLINQLHEMDSELDTEIVFNEVEKKLEIKVLFSNRFSEIESQDEIESSDKSVSINFKNISVSRLIEYLTNFSIWLSKIDKHKHRVLLSFDNGILMADIEEIKTIERTANVSARPEKLLLIDGSNLLHIGYFATKKSAMKNTQGVLTNGVYVFARTFLNLLKQLQPTHVAVCFDKGRETFRKSLYPDYKGHRDEKDEELIKQFDVTRELFRKMNVSQFESDDYEADDLIGTLSKRWSNEKNTPCYIVSNDHDLYQLLGTHVAQIVQKKGNTNLYRLVDFKNQYDVEPEQWIDVKALLGDTSDNIPGVKGVGEKAAIPLIQKYGSIEKLYENIEELPEHGFSRYFHSLVYGKDKAFLSKTLATIITNVPDASNQDLDSLKLNVDKRAMIAEFQRLQFNSILHQIKQGVFRVS